MVTLYGGAEDYGAPSLGGGTSYGDPYAGYGDYGYGTPGLGGGGSYTPPFGGGVIIYTPPPGGGYNPPPPQTGPGDGAGGGVGGGSGGGSGPELPVTQPKPQPKPTPQIPGALAPAGIPSFPGITPLQFPNIASPNLAVNLPGPARRAPMAYSNPLQFPGLPTNRPTPASGGGMQQMVSPGRSPNPSQGAAGPEGQPLQGKPGLMLQGQAKEAGMIPGVRMAAPPQRVPVPVGGGGGMPPTAPPRPTPPMPPAVSPTPEANTKLPDAIKGEIQDSLVRKGWKPEDIEQYFKDIEARPELVKRLSQPPDAGYGPSHPAVTQQPQQTPEEQELKQAQLKELKGIAQWLDNNPDPIEKQRQDREMYYNKYKQTLPANTQNPLIGTWRHLKYGRIPAAMRTPRALADNMIKSPAYQKYFTDYEQEYNKQRSRYDSLFKDLKDDEIARRKELQAAQERQEQEQTRLTDEPRRQLYHTLNLMEPGPEKDALMEQNRALLPTDPATLSAIRYNRDAGAIKEKALDLKKKEREADDAKEISRGRTLRNNMLEKKLAKMDEIDERQKMIDNQQIKLNDMRIKNMPAEQIRRQEAHIANLAKSKQEMVLSLGRYDLALQAAERNEQMMQAQMFGLGYDPGAVAGQRAADAAQAAGKSADEVAKAQSDATNKAERAAQQSTLRRGSLLNRAYGQREKVAGSKK